MLIFGNGAAYGRATADYAGAAIANPTPVRFGVIQDLAFDLSRELKMLYGEKSYPVAVGVGKGKASFKAKLGNFSAAVYGQLFAGRAATTAIKQMVTDDPFVVAASVTTTPPSSGTFVTDYGIVNASTGLPFRRVASAPSVGEYSVTGGTYTFNATDAGIAALRNYEYSVASAVGNSIFTLNNDTMGLAPTFSYIGQTSYLGKKLVLNLSNCISGKFSIPQKNDDFALQDFEFEAFDNGSGTLGYMTITEPS